MIERKFFLTNFFNFKKINLEKNDNIWEIELVFDEHFNEIRQRILQSFFFITINVIIAFLNASQIVNFLQRPISNLKFFQVSPSDFFICTIEISLFFGLLISSPIFINQLILFLFPSFNTKENNIFFSLSIFSYLLFFLGLNFSYFVLIPITLGFFINYSKNNIQPLLSFNEYINFIGVIFFSTAVIFQVPIVQVILGLLNIISGRKMLELIRFIIIGSTILSAIFTPSADPLAQIILAVVLTLLYISGCLLSILFFNKTT